MMRLFMWVMNEKGNGAPNVSQNEFRKYRAVV